MLKKFRARILHPSSPKRFGLALRTCSPGTSKCLNSQNAQKCLREGAKSVFGPLERESQKSLLHGAKPRFRLFPPVRNKVCTVRETLLVLSKRVSQPKDPKSLVAHSLKHFWSFGLFRLMKGRPTNKKHPPK